MGERHLGAPAERAEPPLRLGAGEIVKGDGHLLLRDALRVLPADRYARAEAAVSWNNAARSEAA